MKKLWIYIKKFFSILSLVLLTVFILLIWDKSTGGKHFYPYLSKLITPAPAAVNTDTPELPFAESFSPVPQEQAAVKANNSFTIPSLPAPDRAILHGKFYTAKFWQNADENNVLEALAGDLDINARNADGQTILMYVSSISKNPALINILISHGANVAARDNEGRTALMFASAFNSNPDIITTLIMNKASIKAHDKNGWSPLMYAAAKNRNTAVLQTLLYAGANINERITKQKTSFDQASLPNQFIAATKLSIKSAEKFLKQFYYSLGTNEETDYAEMFNNAIDEMGDELLGKETGMTPLMLAGRSNPSPEVILFMLKNGASPNIADNKGKTAVDYAKDNPFIYQSDAYWKMNDKLYD